MYQIISFKWEKGESTIDGIYTILTDCLSQSHITTDDQSVSASWFRAPSGAHDQMLITVWHLLFVNIGRPLWRGVGSVICLSHLNCLHSSPGYKAWEQTTKKTRLSPLLPRDRPQRKRETDCYCSSYSLGTDPKENTATASTAILLLRDVTAVAETRSLRHA
jgi:hypothetical protein